MFRPRSRYRLQTVINVQGAKRQMGILLTQTSAGMK
jgi:hypothetical protein